MMTSQQISVIINAEHPGIYAPTTKPTILIFNDNKLKVGYFQYVSDSDTLEEQNIFTFIEFGYNAEMYKKKQDQQFVTRVKGNDLKKVIYPA